MQTVSGEYQYFLNGEKTGVTETFRIERHGDSSVKTFSLRDASVYDTTISVTADETGDQYRSFEITFVKNIKARARYTFASDGFRFERYIDGKSINDETYILPAGCLIFPLMRCFQGHTILQVAASQAETTVLVPFIENPDDAEKILTPTFDLRTAAEIRVENDNRVFKYRSKHYDDESEFLINKEGLLTAYRFPQTPEKLWEVRLENPTTGIS